MAVQKFPRPINPKIKTQTDDQLAKVGQLNQLVKDINSLNVTGPSPVTYPFEWFPAAGLTTGGVKFKYTDGVELISYHIKGITPVSGSAQSVEQYICTVSFPEGDPFLFPGSVTGMFQVQQSSDFITTPLADGGFVDVEGTLSPAGGVKFSLNAYGNNPQPSGSYDYALVLSFGVSNDGNISGLASYDYEFLLPNFITPPTIYQD